MTHHQDYWINPRIKIAALWPVVMLIFILVDLFGSGGDVRADTDTVAATADRTRAGTRVRSGPKVRG